MLVSGEYSIPADRDSVWQALNATAVLQACIPGCTGITQLSECEYDATVVTQFGAIRGSFGARVQLTDLVPPERYTLKVEGRGGLAAYCRGTVRIVLKAEGSGTALQYDAELALAGRLASLGARVAEIAARKFAQDFFQTFTASFTPSVAGAAETAASDEFGPRSWWFRRAMNRK